MTEFLLKDFIMNSFRIFVTIFVLWAATLPGSVVHGRGPGEDHAAAYHEHKYKRDLYDLEQTLKNPTCKAAQAKCETDKSKTGESIKCKTGQRQVAVLTPLKSSGCNLPVCTEYQCIYTDCSKAPEGGYSISRGMNCSRCQEPKPVMDCGCKFWKCENRSCLRPPPVCHCNEHLVADACGCSLQKCGPKPVPNPCPCKDKCEKCQLREVYGEGCFIKAETCVKECPPLEKCQACEVTDKSGCCPVCKRLSPPPTPAPCDKKCQVLQCRPHDDTPNCKDKSVQICECVKKPPPPPPTCGPCERLQESKNECGVIVAACVPLPPLPTSPTCDPKCDIRKCVPEPAFPNCKGREICVCEKKPAPTTRPCLECEREEMVYNECHIPVRKCVVECVCDVAKDCPHGLGECIHDNTTIEREVQQKCMPSTTCVRCLKIRCELNCPVAPPGVAEVCPKCTSRKKITRTKHCPAKTGCPAHVNETVWTPCERQCDPKPQCLDPCMLVRVGRTECGCDIYDCSNTKPTCPDPCTEPLVVGITEFSCPIFKCGLKQGPVLPNRCPKCEVLQTKSPSETGCTGNITECVVDRCPEKPGNCYNINFQDMDECGCPTWELKCEEAIDWDGFTCGPTSPCPGGGIDSCGCPKKICKPCESEPEVTCNHCEVEKVTTKCNGHCPKKECVPKPCPDSTPKPCGPCGIFVGGVDECGCLKEVCRPQPCQPLPACPKGEQQLVQDIDGACCPCLMDCVPYEGPLLPPGDKIPAKNLTLKQKCNKDKVCRKPMKIATCEKCVAKPITRR